MTRMGGRQYSNRHRLVSDIRVQAPAEPVLIKSHVLGLTSPLGQKYPGRNENAPEAEKEEREARFGRGPNGH
jgi:hypothetical protein